MSAKSDINKIRADRSLTESEQLWAAITLLAKRFDDKSDEDDIDDVLGLLFDDE